MVLLSDEGLLVLEFVLTAAVLDPTADTIFLLLDVSV